MKYILIRFKGGLANQVYQLAAGQLLGKMLNRNIRYSDIYYRFRRNSRTLMIPSVYDLPLDLSIEKKSSLLKSRAKQWLHNSTSLMHRFEKNKKLIGDSEFSQIINKTTEGNQLISKISNTNTITLDGYFHSSYSINESGVLSKLSILAGSIKNEIAIHIRLGDYLKKPYSEIYNVVNEKYLRSAFENIINRGASLDMPITVFSDTPEIAIKLVKESIPNSVNIKTSNASVLTDLKELSSFRYQILSNSSYSLLAWHLSNESIACIPSNWFKSWTTDKSQFPTSVNIERIQIISQ